MNTMTKNTITRIRIVFGAISFLTLSLMMVFGGLHSVPGDRITLGPMRQEIMEDYLWHSSFISIMKDTIEMKKGEDTGYISGYWKYIEPWKGWRDWAEVAPPGKGDDTGECEGEYRDEQDTYEKDTDEKDKGSPSKPWRDDRYVLGFYVDDEYIHPSSYDSMVKHGEILSAVAPFWYRLSPAEGNKLQEHHPEEGFTAKEMKRIIGKAKAQDMEVLMLVHNLLYGGRADGKELAKKMLATEESRRVFIDDIEAVLEEYEYDGVNLDIENIYLSDRDKFSALIKELQGRLSPKGYKITVCVPAKTTDNLSNTWSGPFDYGEIGKYSDKVAIMTYDEHGYSSGPGPVASYNWVKNVIKYAIDMMPAERILMGIPGYGFDWTAGEKGARYISYSQAINLASSRGANIQWDESARVPYFKYREKDRHHEVWFESKYSLEHKLDIVKEYDIGGIALWRIGLEDAGIWGIIEEKIMADK